MAVAACVSLAYLHGGQRNRDAALAYATVAAALAERTPSPLRAQASIANSLGAMYHALGDYPAAEAEFARSVQWRAEAGDDLVSGSRSNLGDLVALQGRYEEAIELYRLTIAEEERNGRADHPDIAEHRSALGTTLARIDRGEEAETQLKLAIEISSRALGPDDQRPLAPISPRSKAAAAFNLAQALSALDRDRARTEELLLRAVALYEEAAPAGAEDLEEVRAWTRNRPPR